MKTTQRKRLRTVAIGIVAAAAVAFSCLPAITATADAPIGTPNTFASTANSSDPSIYMCGNPVKYCMLTSQDLSIDTGNVYPMEKTLAYTSTDGKNWTAASTAIHEDSIPGIGDANHLWAPGGRYNGYHYLYVPDLTDTTAPYDQYSSRIFLASGADGLTFESFGTQITGIGNETGYMSDPEVFADTATPDTVTTNDYLLWANGDWGSCGQISIEKMTNSSHLATIGTASNPSSRLIIKGWPADTPGKPSWAKCKHKAGTPNPPSGPVTSADRVINEPYIEGATLYNFSRFKYASVDGNPVPGPYTLVFAVKPYTTPDQCKFTGQPNTNNEVIAYATAATPTGEYTYQGIIMCGSKTEWTNQATIIEVKAANQTEWRLMMVYHDGPSADWANENSNLDWAQRRLASECLFTNATNGAGFKLAPGGVGVTRSSEGAVNISGQNQWCLNANTVIALKANGKYVTSTASGLKASSSIIGSPEQFSFVDNGIELQYLKSRAQNKFVTRAADGTLVATANGAFDGQRFRLLVNTADTYYIKDVTSGKWVVVGADGVLRATQPDTGGATLFTKEILAK